MPQKIPGSGAEPQGRFIHPQILRKNHKRRGRCRLSWVPKRERKAVRHVSNVAGLRQQYYFPFAKLKDVAQQSDPSSTVAFCKFLQNRNLRQRAEALALQEHFVGRRPVTPGRDCFGPRVRRGPRQRLRPAALCLRRRASDCE